MRTRPLVHTHVLPIAFLTPNIFRRRRRQHPTGRQANRQIAALEIMSAPPLRPLVARPTCECSIGRALSSVEDADKSEPSPTIPPHECVSFVADIERERTCLHTCAVKCVEKFSLHFQKKIRRTQYEELCSRKIKAEKNERRNYNWKKEIKKLTIGLLAPNCWS